MPPKRVPVPATSVPDRTGLRNSRTNSAGSTPSSAPLVNTAPSPGGPVVSGTVNGASAVAASACLTCAAPVGAADPAIQCEICLKWVHTLCLGWLRAQYDFAMTCKGFHWTCDECDDPNIFASFRDLRQSHIFLERRVNDLAKFADPDFIRSQALGAASEMIADLPQRDKRKLNLAVTGFPSSTDSSDANLFASFCESNFNSRPTVTSTKRVGKSDVQMLVVTLSGFEDKVKILRQVSRLRNNPDPAAKKVFISPDLTRLENEHQFFLRKEVKAQRERGVSDPVIFRGKVIPRADRDVILGQPGTTGRPPGSQPAGVRGGV